MEDRICCIHLLNVNSDLPIKLFNEETLLKCQTALNLRVQNKYAYSDFVLPKEVDKVSGYHSTCYRNFTAVSEKTVKKSLSNKFKASDKTNDEKTDDSSDTCLFCNVKHLKTAGSARESLVTASEKSIQALVNLGLNNINRKIIELTSLSAEISWHSTCKKRFDYNNSTTNTTLGPDDNSDWKKIREAHKNAFVRIVADIDQIIEDNVVGSFESIYNQYMTVIAGDAILQKFDFTNFKRRNLQKKIKCHFGESLTWEKRSKNVYFYRSGLDISNLEIPSDEMVVWRNKILELRQQILNLPKKTLSNKIVLKDIYEGDCELPSLLLYVLTLLIGGREQRYSHSEKKMRLIESIASDIVYAATHGEVRPAKHLQLGIVLKSLSSSRQILDIINHLGHCVSYTVAEELETELTYSASESNLITPKDIVRDSSLSTGIAFDNYDRFVETLTGKNTLHDTVGIIYQNIPGALS